MDCSVHLAISALAQLTHNLELTDAESGNCLYLRRMVYALVRTGAIADFLAIYFNSIDG